MASGYIFRDSRQITQHDTLDLVLNYEYSDIDTTRIIFLLDGQIKGKPGLGRVQINADLVPAMAFQIIPVFDPLYLCIAKCGLVGLVGPLIECFNRDPVKYIDCLKTKGLQIGAGILACVIDCYSTP